MPENSEEKAKTDAKEEDVDMEAKKEEPEVKEETEKKAEDDVKDDDTKEEEAKEEGDGAKEKPAEKEKPKELEEDAAEETRPKIVPADVRINPADTTLNVMPTADGKILMALSEGGMQYLLASARANTGIKSGRYCFEARIVESLNPSEPQGERTRTPQPKQLLRIGLSLAGSSVFLADTFDSVCFDSEGFFVHGKKRAKCSSKIQRDQTVTLLVNLDADSANANTVSLFLNGKRCSPPRKLPDVLVGKTLYPTVTYRNVSVHLNFGPVHRFPLPFTSRMLGDAAQADVDLADVPVQPEPGKCEVVLPVGMPNKGYFDWVDDFVSRNPGYTELSDRKILEWASKSGIWRQKSGSQGSNDKPDLKFGVPLMDDNSVRKAIAAIAPSLRRNYVLPELRANLLAPERKKVLTRFSSHDFKRRAIVLMGEPSSSYKEKVQQLLLADKKAKAAAERKKKLQEEERKRLLEEKKKKAEEVRKAKDAAQKRKAGKAVEEEKDEDEDDKEEEEPKEDANMAEEPVVELTDEEKSMWHRKTIAADIEERTLAKAYANFTIPSTEENLDDVVYDWADEATCAKELKDWILQQKLTQRVEDLSPGEWFKGEWTKWQKQVQEWRKKQGEWKDPVKRKAALAKRKEELKKKKEEEAKEAGQEAPEEEDAKPAEINAEDLDVLNIPDNDVIDIGNGEPLFANFVYEDWTLLSLRFEFHLMLHAFKKDLNDSDRPSFSETHAAFYYNKYFKKTLSLKTFNLENFAGLIELLQDTIKISEADSKFLQCLQDEDASHATFMKLAEDNRRDRQRRLDAGDETAKLKFNKPSPGAPPPRNPPTAAQQAAGGSKYGGSQGNSRWSESTRQPSGGGGGGYSRGGAPTHSSGGNKRPYTPSSQSAYGSGSKYQRTGGHGGGGSGGYYRR